MGRMKPRIDSRKSPAPEKKMSGMKNAFLRPGIRINSFGHWKAIKGCSPSLKRAGKTPLRHSPYKRSSLKPASNLYTIIEESDEEPGYHNDNAEDSSAWPLRDTSLSFIKGLSDIDSVHLGEEGESSEFSDFEGWDDENTLVAKFEEHSPEFSDRERFANLANQLEEPMQEQGVLLRQYLAHTIAPAARKVRDVHNAMDQKVDVLFGVCVLSFDNTCKKMEQLCLEDEQTLRKAVVDSQRIIDERFKQLGEAYRRRERLWQEFRETCDSISDKTLANCSAIPTAVEETIKTLEKKSKDMTKSTGLDGKAKQKILKDLLNEIGY